jgi:enamine deaminase RidA (YjgF/YER057c/UK114 family)
LLAATLLVAASLVASAASAADESRRRYLEPEGLYDHPAYTHVVALDGRWTMLYVAGQVPRGPDGACRAPGNWRGQYLYVMDSLRTALAAGGAKLTDVVHIRRFVTDMDAFLTMFGDEREPLPDYFAGKPPPSTLIEVRRLSDPCYLLEFEVIAAVPAR